MKIDLKQQFDKPNFLVQLIFFAYPIIWLLLVFLVVAFVKPGTLEMIHLVVPISFIVGAALFTRSDWFRKNFWYVGAVWYLIYIFSGMTQGSMNAFIDKSFTAVIDPSRLGRPSK